MFKLCCAILPLALALANSARADITVVRHFRLGEADNVDAGAMATNSADSVRDGQSLVVNGSPLYSADAPNANSTLSLDFDGSTQYATTGNGASLTSNFGLEAWVKPAVAGGEHMVVYCGDPGSSGWGIFQDPATGKFSALFGGTVIFGEGAVIPGVWTHLAFICTDSNATFYVNGVPSGPSVPQLPSAPGTTISIGASPAIPADSFFPGKIDEVRLFTFASGAFVPADLLYTATPRPVLNVNRQGNNTTLVWPTAYFDFGLETTTNFPLDWLPLYGAAHTNGNFTRLHTATDDTRYYRLKTPCSTNAPPMLPAGSFIQLTRGSMQRVYNITDATNPTANSIPNSNTSAMLDASAFVDPADCNATAADLDFHWTINYPAGSGVSNPYSCQGITGYHKSSLLILPSSLVLAQNPVVTFILDVVSHKTGLRTTVTINSTVTSSRLTLSVFNGCIGQTKACPPPDCSCTIANALPATEAP